MAFVWPTYNGVGEEETIDRSWVRVSKSLAQFAYEKPIKEFFSLCWMVVQSMV